MAYFYVATIGNTFDWLHQKKIPGVHIEKAKMCCLCSHWHWLSCTHGCIPLSLNVVLIVKRTWNGPFQCNFKEGFHWCLFPVTSVSWLQSHIKVYLVIFSLRMQLAPAEHVMSFLTIFDKPEVLKRWSLIEQESLQSHWSSWKHFIWGGPLRTLRWVSHYC